MKTINKLLFVLLAFSAIFGAESEKNIDSDKKEISKTSSAIETCKEIAGVAGVIGAGIATTFASETIKECFQKPGFKYAQETLRDFLLGLYNPGNLSTSQKTYAGATLAALYVLYKWYTTEKGKDPKKQVEVDIRPKSYKAFLILLLDKDSGVDLIKRFNYELQTIKKDIETANKQGLELLPLIYPELIASLDATQRQYLNDLIKQVTETDTIVVVPVKNESKPAAY